MIERKRLLSLGYYKKAPSFTGSDKNKCYALIYVNSSTARIWSRADATGGEPRADIYHEIYAIWRSTTSCGFSD